MVAALNFPSTAARGTWTSALTRSAIPSLSVSLSVSTYTQKRRMSLFSLLYLGSLGSEYSHIGSSVPSSMRRPPSPGIGSSAQAGTAQAASTITASRAVSILIL